MTKQGAETFTPKVEIALMAAAMLLCLVVGTMFYHIVEDLSYVDAIYFSAMTLTTVGYGDVTPQTDAGKLFTVAYAFIGIGIFLGFAAAVFTAVLEHVRKRRR